MAKVAVYDHKSGQVIWMAVEGDAPSDAESQAAASAAAQIPQDVDPSVRHEPIVAERGALLPRNINDLRPAFIAGGAMAGAAAGAPAGPLGATTGGVLGAGGGQVAFDIAAEAGRRTGLVGPEGILADDPRVGAAGGPYGPSQRALNEMALDAIFPGGAVILRKAGLGAARRLAGVQQLPARESARRVSQYAEDLGVPLGLENVGGTGFIRGGRTIIGRMPFFSRPFKRADVAQVDTLLEQERALISDISPIVSTVTDTGIDMSRNTLRRATAMRKWFKKQYDSFITDAEAASARIPTENVRQRARDLVDEFGEGLPSKVVEGQAVPIKPPRGEAENEVIEWMRNELVDLADDMSPAQYRRLARTLNHLMVENADNQASSGLAAAVRRGLEMDLENIAGPPELVSRIRDLNGAFGAWADILNSPTGKRIGKTTRGVLGKYEFGALSAQQDTLLKTAFDTNSPQALADLQRLIGPAAFGRAARRHVEDVFETGLSEVSQAGKEQLLSLASVRNSLGIGREGSAKKEAFAAMLRLSGAKTTVADWEKFFDVAEASLSQKTVNVAQLMARRVALAGGRRGLRMFNPANLFTSGAGSATAAGGGFVAGSFLGAGPIDLTLGLLGAFALRKGIGKLFTDPKTLRAATSAIDPNMTPGIRAQAYARFARLMGQDAMREMSDAFTQFARQVTGQAQTATEEALGDLKAVVPR
jgi:hypothetical protein